MIFAAAADICKMDDAVFISVLVDICAGRPEREPEKHRYHEENN
jgi:hypothetical protein